MRHAEVLRGFSGVTSLSSCVVLVVGLGYSFFSLLPGWDRRPGFYHTKLFSPTFGRNSGLVQTV
jgi:hypothetical protein